MAAAVLVPLLAALIALANVAAPAGQESNAGNAAAKAKEEKARHEDKSETLRSSLWALWQKNQDQEDVIRYYLLDNFSILGSTIFII